MSRFERIIRVGSVALAVALAAGPLRAQDQKGATQKTEAEWNAQKVDAKRSQIDATAGAALDQLLKSNPNAKALYDKAYGWAAFDNLKLGFFFSGGGGKGVAVTRKGGKRTYMDMASVGAGLAFGGEKYQVVFLFQTPAVFDAFVSTGWQAQGSASGTAGNAQAGAQTAFVNGMAIYQISATGLMANVDLTGSKYFKDKELN
jgi:lipid-binding SYLF domain-containing protein